MDNQSPRDYEKIIAKLKRHSDMTHESDWSDEYEDQLANTFTAQLTIWTGGRFDGREVTPDVEVDVLYLI